MKKQLCILLITISALASSVHSQGLPQEGVWIANVFGAGRSTGVVNVTPDSLDDADDDGFRIARVTAASPFQLRSSAGGGGLIQGEANGSVIIGLEEGPVAGYFHRLVARVTRADAPGFRRSRVRSNIMGSNPANPAGTADSRFPASWTYQAPAGAPPGFTEKFNIRATLRGDLTNNNAPIAGETATAFGSVTVTVPGRAPRTLTCNQNSPAGSCGTIDFRNVEVSNGDTITAMATARTNLILLDSADHPANLRGFLRTDIESGLVISKATN